MPSNLSVRDDRRTRSKSPGGRDRDRSRSRDDRSRDDKRSGRSRRDQDSSSSSSSEDDRRYKEKRSSKKYYDPPSDDDRRRHTKSSKKYDSESEESDRKRHSKKSSSSKKETSSSKKGSKESASSGSDDISISIHRKSTKGKHESDKTDPRGQNYPQAAPYPYPPGYGPGYPPPPGQYHDTRHMSYVGGDPRYAPPTGSYMQAPERPSQQRSGSFSGGGSGGRYAEVDKYQYAKPDTNVSYRHKDDREEVSRYSEKEYIKTYNSRGEEQIVEVKKEYDRQRDKKYHDDKYDDSSRRMSRLSIGAGATTLGVVGGMSYNGGRPPASPLLEAYTGTYQSISPMPGALVISKHKNDSDLSDFELDLEDDDARSDDSNADLKKKIRKLETEKRIMRSRENSGVEIRNPDFRDTLESETTSMVVAKRVKFYDPSEDARRIAAALEGTHKPPKIVPLIQILPRLTTDNLFALRNEYKKVAKVGGQGINIAKHIKMRVTGNIGKVAYATALGRWESEAYWANSWYQGGASRRELLIESLMGRSNSDIHEIKNCFRDKRYNDDLAKCVKAELSADKFRYAILLALAERRMPESSPLDIKLIKTDVIDLHRALTNPGGETAMIEIIVVRSNAHLREVLKVFERQYRRNFAREMIAKSKNLVGETLAHILNGAMNRPMRDALLLHQAINEMDPGKERSELLISRLVRLHWEPKHLEKVKDQYYERYQKYVEAAIERGILGNIKTEEGKQWVEFCIGLVRSSSPVLY